MRRCHRTRPAVKALGRARGAQGLPGVLTRGKAPQVQWQVLWTHGCYRATSCQTLESTVEAWSPAHQAAL